ncbi:putative transporter [Trachipleistophora hominis]|uniref:Putative transporter n=1 Tax=Trachipleistophora hominis TaxID=72359 RepID=L7JZH3_TRAHO|nr:putative transporter [Trachipleistophora hominis]
MSTLFQFRDAQTKLPFYYILHSIVLLVYALAFRLNNEIFSDLKIHEARLNVSLLTALNLYKTYFISVVLVTQNLFMAKVYVVVIAYETVVPLAFLARILTADTKLYGLVIAVLAVVIIDIIEMVTFVWLFSQFERDFLWEDNKRIGLDPKINGRLITLIKTHIKQEKNYA